MTLADLQSNISISATNAVTGDIEWCTGYTQFSTDIGEQAGWYLALQVTPDVEGATVTAAYNGTIRELDNNIFIIRLADGEDTITFTANKEGYTEGRLTLDISGLDKEFINNYCYVRSLTNGITVTPLQFGESKELSGVVPYDTTTSSNKFRLSFRTFNLIPAGSEISVAHQGTPLGSGTFYVYTPQEGDGEPYSAAEVDITLTQAILDSESPTLSTTISPLDGAVTDRFYCSLNVDNVTLQADPTPRVNITSGTTGVTITPSTYAASKTATGQVPYDTTTSKNILSVALTTSGTLPTGPYTIKVFAQGDVTQQPIWYTTGASTIPQSIPIPLTSNEVGTGKYITINISGQNDPEFNIITIDTSALTLEAAPTPATPPSVFGLGVGDGPNLFQISPNHSTFYSLNNDALCCIDISYTATSVDGSGHTVYEYSATGDSTTAVGYTGMKLLQSSSSNPWFPTQNYQTSEIQNTVFLARHRHNLQTPQPLTGDFMYMVSSSDMISYTGMNCNSFVVFGIDDYYGSDCHYAYTPGITVSKDTATDISSKYYICCCIYGGTASTLQTDGVQIRLYNSDLSDYIVLDIDLSNVIMTTLQ